VVKTFAFAPKKNLPKGRNFSKYISRR